MCTYVCWSDNLPCETYNSVAVFTIYTTVVSQYYTMDHIVVLAHAHNNVDKLILSCYFTCICT